MAEPDPVPVAGRAIDLVMAACGRSARQSAPSGSGVAVPAGRLGS